MPNSAPTSGAALGAPGEPDEACAASPFPPEIGSILDLLLEPSQRVRFCRIVGSAVGAGDGVVLDILAESALSSNERLAFRLAWGIVRGWGPGLLPQDLWGLDFRVSARILAALSAVIAGPEAGRLLDEARRHLP